MDCDEKKLIKYGRNGILQLLLVLLLLAILVELIICLLYFLPMEKSKEIECPQTKREIKQYEGGNPIIVWKRTKTGPKEVKAPKEKVKGRPKKPEKGNVKTISKKKNSKKVLNSKPKQIEILNEETTTTTELTISNTFSFSMNISTETNPFNTTTALPNPIRTEYETEKSNFTRADAICREKYPKGRLMVLYSPQEEYSLINQLKKQPFSYFNECPYIFIGYRVNPLTKYTFSRKFQPLLPLELIGRSASTLNPGISLWDRNCAIIKYTKAKDTFTVQRVRCAGNLYRCYICEFIKTPHLERKIGKEYCNNSTCLDIRDHRYRSLPASSFIRDCKLSNGRLAIIGNLTVPKQLQERIRHLNNTYKCHCRDYPILVYNVHPSPNLETIRSEPLAYKTRRLEYGMSKDNCFSISFEAKFSWVYTPCSQENCFLCRNDDWNPPPYPEPNLPGVTASGMNENATVNATRGEMKQAIMTEEGMINQEWTTIKARTDGRLPEEQTQFEWLPEGQQKDGIDGFLTKHKTEEQKTSPTPLLPSISTLPPDLKVIQPNLNEINPEKFLRNEYSRDSSGNQLSNLANKYKGSHSDAKENYYINYPWNKDDVFAQQRDTDDEFEALVRGHYPNIYKK